MSGRVPVRVRFSARKMLPKEARVLSAESQALSRASRETRAKTVETGEPGRRDAAVRKSGGSGMFGI